MKKILITGASGFVGKNLQSYFRQGQVDTVPFSRSYDGNYASIDTTFLDRQQINVITHLAGKAHDLRKNVCADEYYQANTELTKQLFNQFVSSKASVFIYMSSIKAVADTVIGELKEEQGSIPITHYGKSKFLAEQYILSKDIPKDKRVYILRPCMIHGPGNKGNLNLLYKIASKGIPWPLGTFENKRSFCSIDNLMFIIRELIEREDIPSGVYNIADDEALSTNDVISILSDSQNRKAKIWKISKGLIQSLAKLGDVLRLPLTTERLQKLTESYVVSNQKIKSAIGKDLPVSAKDGLLKSFNSFQINAQ